jgi:hypothetical protein
MGYQFNPFTGNLDTVDSPNGVFEEIDVNGDITLDDGGTFTTTLQTVTATANRTISFPDATGTVGLVAGSSGQLLYNASGANAGASTLTYDGSILTSSGRFINSYNATASSPAKAFTGTWFTGGTSTTTKPQVVIEPTGTTSTSWSTSGTGFGVNAASGFVGRLLDLQLNGTSNFNVNSTGRVSFPLGAVGTPSLYPGADTNTGFWSPAADTLAASTNGTERLRIDSSGKLLVGTSSTSTLGATVQIIGTQALNLHYGAANTTPSVLTLSKSRNATYNSHTIVENGDLLGLIAFRGDDGADYLTSAAWITAEVDGTPGANDMPGRLVFSVTADGGTSPTEALRISNDRSITVSDGGNVVLGTTTGTKIGTATTQKLGFFGVTPVVQQTELTDELTTITHTAPGTADFAIQNLSLTGYGFVTEDEGNTVLSVIANLQARVNELETKLVALGFLADAD